MAKTFVVVGQDKNLRSADGVSWTQFDIIYESVSSRRVIWDGSRFISAGFAGDLHSSTDGITWTDHQAGASGAWGQNTNGLVYAESLGLYITVGEAWDALTSPDLGVWTLRHSIVTSAFQRALAWSPDLTMAVFGDTNGRLFSSPDAITWTERRATGIKLSVNKGIWCSDLAKFFLVGNGGQLDTSSNGTTWTTTTITPFGTDDIWAIAWSPTLSLLVAGGVNGKIATSPDGTTWTSRTSPFGTSRISDGAWSPDLGLFVLVDGTDGDVATSTDGITWTDQSSPATVGMNSVAWGGTGSSRGLVVGSMSLGF